MTKTDKDTKKCMHEAHGFYCVNSSFGGARGLCMTHYVGYRYHVRKKHKTWEELEQAGKCAKKMTQLEKNLIQSHTHKSYKKKSPGAYDF